MGPTVSFVEAGASLAWRRSPAATLGVWEACPRIIFSWHA